MSKLEARVLLGILFAYAYRSRDWLADLWHPMSVRQHWGWAIFLTLLFGSIFIWAFAPIFWEWGQYFITLTNS